MADQEPNKDGLERKSESSSDDEKHKRLKVEEEIQFLGKGGGIDVMMSSLDGDAAAHSSESSDSDDGAERGVKRRKQGKKEKKKKDKKKEKKKKDKKKEKKEKKREKKRSRKEKDPSPQEDETKEPPEPPAEDNNPLTAARFGLVERLDAYLKGGKLKAEDSARPKP